MEDSSLISYKNYIKNVWREKICQSMKNRSSHKLFRDCLIYLLDHLIFCDLFLLKSFIQKLNIALREGRKSGNTKHNEKVIDFDIAGSEGRVKSTNLSLPSLNTI